MTERADLLGSKLWFVEYERRHNPPEGGRYVAISAVGRKWLTLSNHCRVDRSTLLGEPTGTGYGRRGRAYWLKDEFDREVERNRAWEALRQAISERWRAPAGITTEAIQAASTALGLSEPATTAQEGS